MTPRALAALLVVTVAGCHSEPARPAAAPEPPAAPLGSADLDGTLAEARSKNAPVLVLITEPGHGPGDASVRALLHDDPSVKEKAARFAVVDLDLNVSRSRALAGRYHLKTTPLLVYVSSRGVVVRREEGAPSREALALHLDDAFKRAPEIDARFAELESKVTASPDDLDARVALASFLVGQDSWREAIPHLEAVARAKLAPLPVRIPAWVDLARARYESGESEKGLHEARALMAELGSADPEAIAGANLVIARRHMETNRPDLARAELDRAIAAAPDSVYGKQAREEREKLPR